MGDDPGHVLDVGEWDKIDVQNSAASAYAIQHGGHPRRAPKIGWGR